MTKPQLFIVPLLAALSAPIFASAAFAQDRDDRGRQEQRLYDRDHHDYHMWNSDEDRRYREYLNEHHRKYHEFSQLSHKRQREYWRWRHEHGDQR
jgi:hypothetical protein